MARTTAADRRQQLIEAAFRVMARDGVAAATTRAIAAEAGAPLATFHYAFRSKEELLRELTPAIVDRMLNAATNAITPGHDLKESLRNSFRSMWAVSEATISEQHVLYELTQYALRNPGLEDLAHWQYQRYAETARQYLQAAGDAADVHWTPSLAVASRIVVSFLDGLALGWLVDRNSGEARAAIDTFAEQLATLARPRDAIDLGRGDSRNDHPERRVKSRTARTPTSSPH
ncbi:MAG TPA: TetR family transcriptional regulator [Solirubrobacteraceae bacterium]|jgi:AcrR family transcriptional regulator|nr:TetR family transcriptional regulator [Solirubrobacteraceae bacterium]